MRLANCCFEVRGLSLLLGKKTQLSSFLVSKEEIPVCAQILVRDGSSHQEGGQVNLGTLYRLMTNVEIPASSKRRTLWCECKIQTNPFNEVRYRRNQMTSIQRKGISESSVHIAETRSVGAPIGLIQAGWKMPYKLMELLRGLKAKKQCPKTRVRNYQFKMQKVLLPLYKD